MEYQGKQHGAAIPTPKEAGVRGGLSRTPLGWPIWAVTIAITISLIGLYIQRIAVAWSIWESTNSTIWLAVVALADLVPTLILSGPAGVFIDRLGPAKTYWASQVASFAYGFALFGLSATNKLEPAALVACVTFLGACNAFSLPARFSFITLLTPPYRYAHAVALNSLAGNAAMFAGPAIGGILISMIGPNVAFAVTAACYIPVICTLMVIRPAKPSPTQPKACDGILRQMNEGFALIAGNANSLSMLLSFAALAFTARGIITLAPSIVTTLLHGDVRTLSALTSLLAMGAIVGGLCMSKWDRWPVRTMFVTTLGGGAVALLAYGSSAQMLLSATGAIVLGFMLSTNNIAVTSAIQLQTPAQYRGRANSMYNVIFKGGPALGTAAFGGLAQYTDIRVSTCLAAVLLVALLLWILQYVKPNLSRAADGTLADHVKLERIEPDASGEQLYQAGKKGHALQSDRQPH
jgi:MFS family permease